MYKRQIYNAGMALVRRSALPAGDNYTQYRYCGDWLFWIQIVSGGDVYKRQALIAVGGGILADSIHNIRLVLTGEIIGRPGAIALIAAAISIVAKEVLYRYTCLLYTSWIFSCRKLATSL